MMATLRKLQRLFRRSRQEAELREELQFHLGEEAEERGGDHPAARRELGNLALVQENTRVAWGWARLEQFARDVGHGMRQVRRNPLFSGLAIATLALGIGGITAIFSAFDAVLIRRLPYAEPERLVMIWDKMSSSDVTTKHMSTPAEWIEWRRLNTVLSDIACTQPTSVTFSGDGEPEEVPARKATWNLWSVLGVQPLLGRVYTEDEQEKGALVAVISHGLWQRRFGGSPAIIGRKVTLNDQSYEVVGVMPEGFYFMPSRDIGVWMPSTIPPWMRKNLTWHDTQMVARLKPGVTLDQARTAMNALSLQVTAADFRGPHGVVMNPLREELMGKTQSALIILMAASAALLLIACVNLANLLLSRSAARAREVAVRTAIGAGRGRLVAQFLAESLVLAGLGGAAGLAMALPAMRYLETLIPETMGNARLTLDWRVLGFSAAAALASSVVFGLAPAIRGSRTAPLTGLREGGRGATGPRSHWFQHSLIVVETALAVTLLTCGGLLLQTFEHLRNNDLGIRVERLLTFELPLFRYPDFGRRVTFIDAGLDKVRQIPGVIRAGAINRVPFTEMAEATFYLLDGQPLSENGIRDQVALQRNVSQDYFQTVGARLREGRFFDTSDRRSSERVAIINEQLANRHFPGQSAIGKRFKFGHLDAPGYWYTVVGVVRPIRDSGVLEDVRPTIYRVQEQCDQMFSGSNAGIVVRTAVEPESLVSAVREAIWSLDRNQSVARVRTMEEIVSRQLSTPSQSASLLAAFALLALVLASLGIYGVLSYAVTQRTNEIGVRMALGASPGEIMRSFGTRGLAFASAGLGLGIALSFAAARFLTALLYGFEPGFAVTVTVVSLVLMAVAALACFVPARRASRLDPVIALRNE